MKLNDHRLLIEFLEPVQALAGYACNVKDGKFDGCKAELISFLEAEIKEEETRSKLYQDDKLKEKLIAFYTSALGLLQ
jgi:hypothetical protein